jgi:hypothetical protein
MRRTRDRRASGDSGTTVAVIGSIERDQRPRVPPFRSMNSMLAAASSLSDCSQMGRSEELKRLDSFRKTVVALPPLLWRLSQAHAWSATVLVDELDARRFQGAANCQIVCRC